MTVTGDWTGFSGIFDVLGGVCVFRGSLAPNAGFVGANGNSEVHGEGEITSRLLVQQLLSVLTDGSLRLTGAEKRNFGLFEAPATTSMIIEHVTIMQDGNGPFGTVRADGGTVTLGEDALITDGTIEAINGGAIEVTGHTTVRDLAMAGSVDRRAGGQLTLEQSDWTMSSADEFVVTLDATDSAPAGSPGVAATSAGAGTVSLAGTLRVRFADGFTPVFGQRFTLIGGAIPGDLTITGEFDTFELPELGLGVVRAAVSGSRVEVITTCTADLAAPFGVLDEADVIAQIIGLEEGHPDSDFAPPMGTFDIFDLLAYLDLTSAGCQ